LLLLASVAAAAEEIFEIPTRPGVIQPYLLSYEPDRKYSAVALLFSGGAGVIGLRERGRPTRHTNFVVRTRNLFVKRGIATAVVDVPSDRSGMSDDFRLSQEHAADVAAVIDDVKKRFPDARVYLVGTSRGTISAGYAGAALSDRISGVVLTASLFVASKSGPGLARFDFRSIKTPVLFVHHRDDGCAQTPYSEAQRLSGRFPLVSVSGGDAPISVPCEALSYHGFLGREEPVVDAISAWIFGKPVPSDIQ
jgi:pimeloyl-ACP methyl ester carboxylesterase